MMRLLIILMLFIGVLADYDKVTVEVYYEALCPGCQEFITGPLTSTLAKEDIAAIVDLKMVPYGNTKYADGVYTCQHGDDECTSDVYEQCVLYKLSGNITSIETGDTSMTALPFLQCMEENEGNPSFAEACYTKNLAVSSGISWDTILTCSSEEASAVQAAAASATPTHDYVPWILVDGTLLEHTDLLQATICKDYTGPQPTSCKLLQFIDSRSMNEK